MLAKTIASEKGLESILTKDWATALKVPNAVLRVHPSAPVLTQPGAPNDKPQAYRTSLRYRCRILNPRHTDA
jgi:hypothetical protein